MTFRSTRPGFSTHTTGRRIGAVLRTFVALLIVVALPAQAISASVERVWNAAHYHLAATDSMETQTVPRAGQDSRRGATTEHYPLQLVQDITQGRHHGLVASRDNSNPQAARLDAHAEAHRSAKPHHHNGDARDVVYVASEGDAPTATPERTGKHDHEGFSPAMLVAQPLATRRQRPDSLLFASIRSASHHSSPGDRPPR